MHHPKMDSKQINTFRVALGFGSNIGDRQHVLRAAVDAVATYVTVEAISPVYETVAAYVTDQPPFLNAAVIGVTSLNPMALLWNLKRLEIALGREPTFRYGPRRIDIDILFYGDQVIAGSELHIPHLRLQDREFVLRPLADIASDWRHPQSGLTVAEMLEKIDSLHPVCLGPL